MANHLRTMTQPDFILLLQKIYRSLLNGIEGVQAQGVIIVDVLSTLGCAESCFMETFVDVQIYLRSQLKQKVTDVPALEEDLADIVCSSAELSNTQAAKVISYRAEQHSALELVDFLTFFNDSWAFVIKCETICRRMIVGLRGTVVGQVSYFCLAFEHNTDNVFPTFQAKLFLQAFHQARISRSAKLVEDELWNPTEVTPGLQQITNTIVDSAVRDPPDLIIKSEDTIFSPSTVSFPTPSPTTTSSIAQSFSALIPKSMSNGSSSAPASTKHLRIEERTHYVVSATAEVLTLLLDYLRVVINLPMLTTDTMSRVVEFLKSFNSRTCQVVLGAGAMRSAGLKNITAKHLGKGPPFPIIQVLTYFILSPCISVALRYIRTHSICSGDF